MSSVELRSRKRNGVQVVLVLYERGRLVLAISMEVCGCGDAVEFSWREYFGGNKIEIL